MSFGGKLSDFLQGEGAAPVEQEVVEEAPKIPHPEHDAKGYVKAVVMQYLTPGFEALLQVAKEKGELPPLGEELMMSTFNKKKEPKAGPGDSSPEASSDADEGGGDPSGLSVPREGDENRFDPLRWLSDYLRQYVDKPGKYKEMFNQRLAERQREMLAQAANAGPPGAS
ncbi:unnamed protein product [Amoebophrya sp. A25]|nr:unnamed protein product [Amoebophrya sp. A25]|eukprot:GSA25T00012391001.1